ncbi:MAG: cupin domain-containing protein, partial [Actinomycetota bacterium]
MYVPSILSVPLAPTGPVRADHPQQALTSDWPLLDDGQVQIGVWECTPGTFSGSTGDFDETMFMVSG